METVLESFWKRGDSAMDEEAGSNKKIGGRSGNAFQTSFKMATSLLE